MISNMENLDRYIYYIAQLIEALGVLAIVVGTVVAFWNFLFFGPKDKSRPFRKLRLDLGKGILLGLEILVAGDIIATVVTEHTIDRVVSLGLIVLIRIILSISIELEIEGKFPWHKGRSSKEKSKEL